MVSAQWRKNRPVQGPERAEKEGAHMYDTHIFLDFEMNPIPRECREARETARSEIVEIGAVKLDREYRLVDRYSCYVKPEYGPIHKRITQLTGITDADVARITEIVTGETGLAASQIKIIEAEP